MSRQSSIIFSIIAVFIFVLSIAFFFGRLSVESQNGSEKATETFSLLKREIITPADEDGFMNGDFVSRIKNILKKTSSVAAAVITGPDGTEFAWPLDSPFLAADGTGDPRITVSSPLVKVISSPVNVGDTRNVTVTAAVYVLPPAAVYHYGRNTFLVILAVTLCTVICIIYDNLKKQKNGYAPESGTDEIPYGDGDGLYTDDFSVSDSPGENLFFDMPSDNIAPLTLSDYDTIIDDIKADDEPDFFPEYGETGTDENSGPEAADSGFLQGDSRNTKQETPVVDSKTDPAGLFSPATGFGWEQYLETRLDAELSRAASSEQDLAFIIILFGGTRPTDLAARKTANILLDYFKFRDLVFEYGDNGYAGILQNVNLDQAMITAEKMYTDLKKASEENAPGTRIAIGISTRTLRLIPGVRIMDEAAQAAAKAFDEEKLPIVAFRVDPEKYRRYIAEKRRA